MRWPVRVLVARYSSVAQGPPVGAHASKRGQFAAEAWARVPQARAHGRQATPGLAPGGLAAAQGQVAAPAPVSGRALAPAGPRQAPVVHQPTARSRMASTTACIATMRASRGCRRVHRSKAPVVCRPSRGTCAGRRSRAPVRAPRARWRGDRPATLAPAVPTGGAATASMHRPR